MEKLKLTEKQKYCLLQDAAINIVSQGRYPHPFLSPYECDRVIFNTGVFSQKKGARVEVIYSFRNCKVRLLWHYVRKDMYNDFFDFVFIPKAVTVEREFKNSILISVLPDPEFNRFIYQSTKSIYELCVEDSEEGEGVAVGQGSVCPAGESGDSPLPNENKHSVAM